MSKPRLISDVENFEAFDVIEEASRQLTEQFLKEEQNNFCRSNLDGHVTGCGVVTNPERTHLLVIHHLASGGWWLPGGHADGESIIQKVARREVMEETGLEKVKPVSPNIFDIGVHAIDYRKSKNEPEHYHYDIRYVFEAEMDAPLSKQEEEVGAVKWLTFDEILKLNDGIDMQRIVSKVKKLKPSRR